MPVELLTFRAGDALRAAGQADRDEMDRLPRGFLTITVTQKPNDKQSAWYRVLAKTVAEATGRWPNGAAFHREMMLRLGFVDYDVSRPGTMRLIPQTTTEWDALQWRDFIDAVLVKIAVEIAPEINDRRLRETVEAAAGMTLNDARKEVA